MKDINIISPNTTLSELQSYISVRSHTICYNTGFETVKDIIQYFLRNKTFKKIRSCGEKTEIELCKLSQDVLKNYREAFEMFEQSLKEETESVKEKSQYIILTQVHLKILSMYIKNNLQKLEKQNVRAKNSIENLWENNEEDFIRLHNFLISIEFNYLLLKNAGVNTLPTIQSFFNLIFAKANELLESQKNNTSDDLKDVVAVNAFDQAYLNLDSLFSSKDNITGLECFEKYKSDYLNREFPLLKYIEELLDNYIILDERKTQVFKYYYNYFSNISPIPLDELSEQHHITRERVRQMTVTLIEEFWGNIEKIVKCLDLSYSKSYKRITKDSPFISLTQYDLDSLRKNYTDNFNLAFTHKLISVFDANYVLLHDEGIRSSGRKSKVFRANNNFLIKRECIVNFRLDDFFEDFYSLISGEIDEDFLLSIEGYISNYFIDKKELKFLPILRQFVEEVVLKEFGIISDFEDNLIIPRNTRMNIADYVYEALKDINKPSHITEIFEWVGVNFPNLKINKKSLGTSALRDERIIFFGRSSTYGLKEWESLGVYKGGTIRSIVEEYLNQYDTPQHIFDISEYMLKYRRETNIKSLEANLKLIADSEILSYGNGYWGLKNKPVQTDFKIVPIPNKITRMLKSNYFYNSNKIAYETLLNNLIVQYGITSVQARYYIQTKIEHGMLILDRENLIITLTEC